MQLFSKVFKSSYEERLGEDCRGEVQQEFAELELHLVLWHEPLAVDWLPCIAKRCTAGVSHLLQSQNSSESIPFRINHYKNWKQLKWSKLHKPNDHWPPHLPKSLNCVNIHILNISQNVIHLMEQQMQHSKHNSRFEQFLEHIKMR